VLIKHATEAFRLLAVLIAALVLAPAAAPAAETPGGFITRILKDEITGRWGLQWQSLHPGHKALITEAQYVACSRVMGTDFATGREVLHVVSVRNDPIAVRGVPQRTSKLVTITLHQREKTNGLTYHMHAVRVGGRWAWILGKPFLSSLAQGRCLDGSPLQR
jgi:hypothetical protein